MSRTVPFSSRNMGTRNMGTDGKFPLVSLRTNQELQESFRLSPSFGNVPVPKFPSFVPMFQRVSRH
jgi:hypothetical protein